MAAKWRSIPKKDADRDSVSHCRDCDRLPINRAAAVARTADTTLIVRMQRRFIVDRDLFTGIDVAQRDKEDVVVQDLHERVGAARVIDVMRAVAAAAAVETPATIHFTNPEHAAMRSASRFGV